MFRTVIVILIYLEIPLLSVLKSATVLFVR
jgi:hypothetical protein